MKKGMKGRTMKHTPGPWKVRQSYDNGEPSCLTVYSGADGICDIYLGEKITEATEIAEANARLIAAAPEMLRVLKETSKLLWGSGYDRCPLEAIIAKAEGGIL